MSHAGICHACQNDVLKQRDFGNIYCESCNATWRKKGDAHCPDCILGKLSQDYPNTIYCSMCGSKWYNNALSQFGKSLRGYYSSKHKAGRT